MFLTFRGEKHFGWNVLTFPRPGNMLKASHQSGSWQTNQKEMFKSKPKEIFSVMFKIKLLTGLAALVVALAVSVAPASAWFESTGSGTTGHIKKFPETTVFKTSPTSQSLECKSATGEPAGEWEIYSESGVPAKAGPYEQLKIKKWGHCVGPVELPLKVSCSLLIEQKTKSTSKPQSATGAVEPGCQVGLENGGTNKCVIKVPSQSNRELKEVKLAGEVEISSEVKGITSTREETNETCKKLTIGEGKEGEFKTKNALVTEGQKLV